MKCMCVLIAAWAAACLSVEAGALKVLMIGNSFSQSVLKQMPAVARATGCELDLANLYIGGCPLDLHWRNVEKAATDAEARPYEVGLSWTSCAAQDAPIQKVMKGGRANIPQALRPPTPLPFFGDPVGQAWWSAQGKLQIDALHFNPAGEYLQGCVWVAALFGKDVTACTYAPAGLSEKEAALMRVCAWEAVAGEMK